MRDPVDIFARAILKEDDITVTLDISSNRQLPYLDLFERGLVRCGAVSIQNTCLR
jgi:hypothetical protein